MATSTVRISEQSVEILRVLSKKDKTSMQSVLDKALDAYQRKLFFEEMNAAYAALRADPVAWAEELTEREEWDTVLMDGIDADDIWEEGADAGEQIRRTARHG